MSVAMQAVFKTPEGRHIEVEVAARASLMSAAKDAGIPGIDADCGGSMVCGTCHVYVDPRWLDCLPASSEMEREILDCVPAPHSHARLSCQIAMEPSLDGIQLRIPPRQR
ncbi:MAG: 2Fe-2S iron-sulfur cluster-binding protein [Panacagrimonas sp.]